MKNFVHQGHTLTVVAPYNVTTGGGVKVGNIFGIAANTQVTGDYMSIDVDGVFDLVKDASTFASGDNVYWDDVAKKATSNANAHMHIGTAELAIPGGTTALGGNTGDATVRLRLIGSFGFNSGALRVAHFLYNFAVDGGASCTPVISDTIPANAVVFGGVVNSTTALTSGGASTFAVGTTAGSSASSILTATAKASLGLDAVVAATCATTPFKMSAAGQINVAIATGPLTAGVVEGWVYYVPATNA